MKKTPSALPYILGGAALGAAVSALPFGLAWAFLHPPRRRHKRTPQSFLGVPFERVRLTSADGVRLSAWFVAAPAELPVKGVVVVCHGYSGNRGKMLPYLAFLHRAGYHALLFDFRAHGWSGGTLAGFGSHEAQDLISALDWVEAQAHLADLPLFLLGESMGAAVALLVAAADTRIRAVVADSPYARLDGAVEGHLIYTLGPKISPAIIPPTRRVGEKLLGLATQEVAPMDAVRKIAPRPVLLIHGLSDTLISPDNARRIYEAAPGNVELWEVPDARHVKSVHIAGDEYARRVLAFLEAALTSKITGG